MPEMTTTAAAALAEMRGNTSLIRHIRRLIIRLLRFRDVSA